MRREGVAGIRARISPPGDPNRFPISPPEYSNRSGPSVVRLLPRPVHAARRSFGSRATPSAALPARGATPRTPMSGSARRFERNSTRCQCQTCGMSITDPSGSHVHAIWHHTVAWAVSEVVQQLGTDKIAKLKVASGEHLAAMLATAFLGAAPVGVDVAGGPDLVFDLSKRAWDGCVGADLVGRDGVQFADFEVKSLPGPFREFDAAINRAIRAGIEPNRRTYSAQFGTAKDVLRSAEGIIEQARQQLHRKSGPERSRNVFLIAHFLDYPIVEVFDAPLFAHHLEPLDLPDGIDSLWMLFVPHGLAAWSVDLGRWTNLVFSSFDPDEGAPETAGLDLLQYFDLEFHRQTGSSAMSPWVYILQAGGDTPN